MVFYGFWRSINIFLWTLAAFLFIFQSLVTSACDCELSSVQKSNIQSRWIVSENYDFKNKWGKNPRKTWQIHRSSAHHCLYINGSKSVLDGTENFWFHCCKKDLSIDYKEKYTVNIFYLPIFIKRRIKCFCFFLRFIQSWLSHSLFGDSCIIFNQEQMF